MPGTGKTTTIAAIIRSIVAQGKTVLLASYTHSAVDNILLKIKDDEFDILRLGALSKIHEQVQKFSAAARKRPETEQELEELYMRPPVVATTCLGINHLAVTRRTFDYCIIDEASQITLPSCLGPIRFCKSFILVGDHHQLGPVIRNPLAYEGGLDVSLFMHLCKAHPEAVVNLEHQYRMCSEIMLLSNQLVYDGLLKCGSTEVSNQTLSIPNKKALDSWRSDRLTKDNHWLSVIIDETAKVVFLNTDAVPAVETSRGDRVQNDREAEIVRQIAEALCACGVPEASLGIISLYRSQLKILSHSLRHRSTIEILTADRFQGRDKDCVIISLVRSNDKQMVGDLLKDWRRLNVTFTRAKSKLIIVGSRRTLETTGSLNAFFSLIDSNNWMYKLPPNSDRIYDIPVSKSSQKKTGSSPDKASVNSSGSSSGPPKVHHIGKKILENRNVLRDIINETK